MNYYNVVEKAINYIEGNLYEEISIKHVANEVGFSVPHFYRIFSSIVGESLKTYIRKRRISNAAFMIKESDLRICDIAFESGFESHEAFIRAFKRMYGVPPKDIKSAHNFSSYESFNVSAKKERMESGVIFLETPIIYRDSFKIIGKTVKLNQAEQVNNNEIDTFMKAYLEENHNDEDTKMYSIYQYDPDCINEEDEDINYLYTLGVEYSTSNEKVPKGMSIKEIPDSKYALFVHNKKENTLNGVSLLSLEYDNQPITNIYDYIDGVWIPNSGHILSDNPDFEIRDLTNKDAIEYYISITA